MKILLATMQFGRGYGQGTERYIAMLAHGLKRCGHAVVVLAGDPERRGAPASPGERVEQDPDVRACPAPSRMAVVGRPTRDVRAVIAREAPDVVHMVNPGHIGLGPLLAAVELDLPTVVTVVDYWWLCPKHTLLHHTGRICDAQVTCAECLRCMAATDRRGWMRTLAGVPGVREALVYPAYFARARIGGLPMADLLRWPRRRHYAIDALNRAGAVIFLSDGARRRIAPLLTHERHDAIRVGLEPRWFAAHTPRPTPPAGRPDALTLGFVGSLVAHKGPHLLLDALHQLGWTRTLVQFAGRGAGDAYERGLRRAASGLNVVFAGQVPTERMPAFLHAIDLLVVPSIWPENLPQTVLEAQAVGVPVLASDVDGISEVVTDATMRFAPNQPADLTRRLRAWAECPLRPLLAPAVPTAEEMVDRTLSVYEAVVRGARPSGACAQTTATSPVPSRMPAR